MMLAVRKTHASFGVSLDQIPLPGSPGPNEVLIQVAATGICGSDVHVYEWTDGYDFMKSYLPVVLGHEFSGIISDIGPGVEHLQRGDRVVVTPGISCMKCPTCARGEPHLCPNKQSLGLTRNGGFAPYVRVPAQGCFKLPEGTDLTLAAVIEPLCIGDNAADIGEVTAGDTVVVLGPGTIGQAIVGAAHWRGASRIIAVGMNDAPRLEVARTMGATHLIDLADGVSLQDAVFAVTGGAPADVVIEATGHPSSIADGFKVLRKGGILVAAGIHSKPASFDLTGMIRNKQQLRGAHGSVHRNWERMIHRVATEPEAIRPMVSMTLALQDAEQGFRLCQERKVSKVVLTQPV